MLKGLFCSSLPIRGLFGVRSGKVFRRWERNTHHRHAAQGPVATRSESPRDQGQTSSSLSAANSDYLYYAQIARDCPPHLLDIQRPLLHPHAPSLVACQATAPTVDYAPAQSSST